MRHDGMSTGLFQDEEDGYNLEEDTHCGDHIGDGTPQDSTLDETKYKLKLDKPSSDVGSEDDFDLGDEEPDLDFGGDEGGLDLGDEESADDKPFDDEPFDAGVEADEESDPETYIQQLSGKLGQSLRKHTDDSGAPDYDLEKFAINSVISATHTADMDPEDQKDIIEKVKTSGRDDEESLGQDGGEAEPEIDVDADVDIDGGDKDVDIDADEEALDLDEGLSEKGIENWALFGNIGEEIYKAEDVERLAKMFKYMHEKLENERAKDALMYFYNERKDELEKGIQMNEGYIKRIKKRLNEMNEDDNPCWKGYEQVGMKEKDGKEVPNCVPVKETLQEAEYQGKTVKLNKPMRGDVKKFKVYVKNDKGNVVKVNFGDKNMEIKRDDPERRKSFRARHNCSSPGPKWKARYWSCKMWSKKSVSDILGEGIEVYEYKRNIFNPKKKVSSKMIKDEAHVERQIVNVDKLTDKAAFITVHLNGEDKMIKFINTNEILDKPMAYDEPWVYAYDSVDAPDGNEYVVGVNFLGHPQTNLDLADVADSSIELK